ncbi:MAG: hypothetical protein HYU87_11080 [Chloroflexi bacterium]|nr:hypothetical protein [Chloroflexota bacterium]
MREIVRTSGGALGSAGDPCVHEAIASAARAEGLLLGSVGGTTIAAIGKLAEKGLLGRRATVIACLAEVGSGGGAGTGAAVPGTGLAGVG